MPDGRPVRSVVFIGGTGQSGTSTANHLLGGHSSVLTCPFETSFIIAPGGLIDVIRVVSDDYSAPHLDMVMHAFDRLMHHHLCSPRSYPYTGFDLANYFGKHRYHSAVERFIVRLGVHREKAVGFNVDSFARVAGFHSPHRLRWLKLPGWLARERTHMYFARQLPRSAALGAARQLLDDLFGDRARELGKTIWCEQTSTNQQFVPFLRELCPDGLYVNTVRDPLDVALANYALGWAPSDFAWICGELRSRYESWRDTKRTIPDDSYLDVRFEELIDAPERVLARMCTAIGIANEAGSSRSLPHSQDLRTVRERRLTADLATYRRILGPIAEELGYPVP